MKPHTLLRLYPSAWRARYGEELSELLNAQPMSIGLAADLVRGALGAHVHVLRSGLDPLRSSAVSERWARASRLALIWTPVAALCVATTMVLLDFWYGHSSLCGPEAARCAVYRLVGSSWVRTFQYDELYELVLHLSMLALALAAALIFMAIARRATARPNAPAA